MDIGNFDEERLAPGCFEPVQIQAYKCHCNRCGYEWPVYTDKLPKTCANPKCRSPYWCLLRVRTLSDERIMKPKV